MSCCDLCPYMDECEPEKNIPPTTPLLPCWWEYDSVEDWKKGAEEYKKQQEKMAQERADKYKAYWKSLIK